MTDTQVQELLNPRFKVVALWPSTDLRIGDIVGVDMPLGESAIKFYEEYPHLFKRLEWWEERRICDMPKYVRCIKTPDQLHLQDEVFKVEWNSVMGVDEYGDGIITNTNCYVPATEEEYLSFINQTK